MRMLLSAVLSMPLFHESEVAERIRLRVFERTTTVKVEEEKPDFVEWRVNVRK